VDYQLTINVAPCRQLTKNVVIGGSMPICQSRRQRSDHQFDGGGSGAARPA